MGDFSDSVSVILSRVERRVEVAAQNISNLSTPGYKRAVGFESILDTPADETVGLSAAASGFQLAVDVTPGELQNTGNPGDLAIVGAGFFSVRTHEGHLLYTRQGQFRRDADGYLVNTQGGILQQQGGGDLVLASGGFTVLGDGTVLQAGEAAGRVAVVTLSDPSAVRYDENGLYSAPQDTALPMDAPSLAQGALEASNVSTGAEMITMMAALREAQSGQRLMGIYDDLLGRAITTFGQG